MLNEVRKKDIALGLFEYSQLQDVEEKRNCIDPMLLRKVSGTR
jgi:hypothetical protein